MFLYRSSTVDDLKITGKWPVLQHVYNMSTTSCRQVHAWLARHGHAVTDMSTTCLQLVRVVESGHIARVRDHGNWQGASSTQQIVEPSLAHLLCFCPWDVHRPPIKLFCWNFSTLSKIPLPHFKFLFIYSYFSTFSQTPLHCLLNFYTLTEISPPHPKFHWSCDFTRNFLIDQIWIVFATVGR